MIDEFRQSAQVLINHYHNGSLTFPRIMQSEAGKLLEELETLLSEECESMAFRDWSERIQEISDDLVRLANRKSKMNRLVLLRD